MFLPPSFRLECNSRFAASPVVLYRRMHGVYAMETLSLRVPDDVKEQVEQLADENDNTQSDQARQLLRAGLDDHERANSVPPGYIATMFGAMLFGSAAITVQVGTAATTTLLGLLLMSGGLLIHHSQVQTGAKRAYRAIHARLESYRERVNGVDSTK